MKADFKILIIEDELVNAKSIRDCILGGGFVDPQIRDNYDDALLLFHSSKISKPNLVICEIQIKGAKDGIDLAKEIRKISACKIIFLTANYNSSILDEMLEIEPDAFLLKPCTELQLKAAIEICFKKYRNEKYKSKINLSPREFEIVKLVKKGLSSKEIAEKLFISLETVHTHRRKILSKNNAKNFIEIINLL